MTLAMDLMFSVVADDALALGDSVVTSFSEKSGCGIGDGSTFFAADGAGVSYATPGDE
jgi:hypothetical protein